MHFEKSSLRTGRVNEAVRYIYMIDSALGENKNRTNENKSHLSCDVGMTGFEPAASRPPDERATGLRYIPNFGGANLRKIGEKGRDGLHF